MDLNRIEERSLTKLTQRPGRLIISLALALSIATAAAPGMAEPALRAPVCQVRPTNSGRSLCWCRTAYGWRSWPMTACRIWRKR